ncbi:MAG: hypothetical protein ACT4OX_08390 [Actinomycetota bacterium]
MAEPEAALVFTPEPWVEELHRHLTDHGGARVRQIVVEPSVALEENYDVLVASHRWPALTRAFVADVHGRGRVVLGVYDRDEPAGRAHLAALGVDSALPSDAGPKAFVDVLVLLHSRRLEIAPRDPLPESPPRPGRIIVVGGPPGSGRTEVALHLACALGAVVLDADDVAPSLAQRVGLPIEPNLRTAIDAAEHGRGRLDGSISVEPRSGVAMIAGVPNPDAWAQMRPGEVVRVAGEVARTRGTVVVDTSGLLDDIGGPTRGRYAVARAFVIEADMLVGVASASPIGVSRFLSWAVQVRALAPDVTLVAVVNQAPADRYRRGELYDELTRSLPLHSVVFVAPDPRVGDACWSGTVVTKGAFARGITQLAGCVVGCLARRVAAGDADASLEWAS